MAAVGIARRYAQAAFELAEEKGQLDEWRRDLDRLAITFSDPKMIAMFANPRQTQEVRDGLMQQLLQGKINPLVYNLVKLLVDRGHANRIPAVVAEFVTRYNRARNIAVADVTTAIALDEAARQNIAARLSRITGKQVQIRTHVDPSIIGGLVARIGDELIDGSVATRLQEMAQRLTAR